MAIKSNSGPNLWHKESPWMYLVAPFFLPMCGGVESHAVLSGGGLGKCLVPVSFVRDPWPPEPFSYSYRKAVSVMGKAVQTKEVTHLPFHTLEVPALEPPY